MIPALSCTQPLNPLGFRTKTQRAYSLKQGYKAGFYFGIIWANFCVFMTAEMEQARTLSSKPKVRLRLSEAQLWPNKTKVIRLLYRRSLQQFLAQAKAIIILPIELPYLTRIMQMRRFKMVWPPKTTIRRRLLFTTVLRQKWKLLYHLCKTTKQVLFHHTPSLLSKAYKVSNCLNKTQHKQ